MQFKYCNADDCKYIIDSIFSLSFWEVIEIEESMRWWLVRSIWREIAQLENKARAKKWEESLKIEVATLTQNISDTRAENVRPNQVKSSQVKSSQTKSIQTKTNQNKSNQNISIFNEFISNTENQDYIVFDVIKYFFELWWKPAKNETPKKLEDWVYWIFNDYGVTNPDKMKIWIKWWYTYWSEVWWNIKNVKSNFLKTIKNNI